LFGTPLRIAVLPLWALPLPFFIWPAIAVALGPIRSARRRARGACGRCGYTLHGNPSGVCSECGSPYIPARQETAHVRASTSHWTFRLLRRCIHPIMLAMTLAAGVTALALLIGSVFATRTWSLWNAPAFAIGVRTEPARLEVGIWRLGGNLKWQELWRDKAISAAGSVDNSAKYRLSAWSDKRASDESCARWCVLNAAEADRSRPAGLWRATYHGSLSHKFKPPPFTVECMFIAVPLWLLPWPLLAWPAWCWLVGPWWRTRRVGR
jgi:hypothetical protein